MDSFIVEHKLWSLQKQINEHKTQTSTYFTGNDANLANISDRITDLEAGATNVDSFINSLRNEVEGLKSFTTMLLTELNQVKLVNIKQDLVIRTYNNLQAFDGYGMFTDTFVNGDNIDWEKSIRAELMNDYQAVGKTRRSVVDVKQTMMTGSMMISKNGSSDDAFAQTFILDKTKEVDMISLYIGKVGPGTTLPLRISILDTLGGGALSQTFVAANDITTDGWIDIDMPNVLCNAGVEYYIDIRTDDTTGYKIGLDTADNYLPGTSFSRFNNTWTDNNFDISFKVWAYPSEDENNATIFSKVKTFATVPTSIVFEREDRTNGGSVQYFVSRDGGVNWKILQPGVPTDLNDLPSGKDLVLKAFLTENSRIEAWGYVVVRSDS